MGLPTATQRWYFNILSEYIIFFIFRKYIPDHIIKEQDNEKLKGLSENDQLIPQGIRYLFLVAMPILFYAFQNLKWNSSKQLKPFKQKSFA